MCRWMAWLGQPVLMEELLFKSPHGIVDQSLHALGRSGNDPDVPVMKTGSFTIDLAAKQGRRLVHLTPTE